MKKDKLVRTVINLVGFPFTITNSIIQRKNVVKEPGVLFSVKGREVHAIISGREDANDTVVFDAGLSCCSLDWHYIQAELSDHTKVVSFDRAGYGWSSRVEEKYTSLDVVEDLMSILQKGNLKPPYILVGHSFGGLNMRLFASKYPEMVKALILVDAVHENRYISDEWDDVRKKVHQKNKNLFKFGYLTSGIGLPRLLKQAVGRKYLGKELQKQVRFIGYHPNSYEAVYREFFYSEESAKQVKNSSDLPKDLPVTIISSNNSDPTWIEHQRLLTELTRNTVQKKTENSHSVHLENPQIVVESVLEFVKGERTRSIL